MPEHPSDREAVTDLPDPTAIATRQDFATALGRLREHAGLTVRELGKAAGSPASTIGGYLSGRHVPPLNQPELLLGMLRACGVADPEQLSAWRRALERVRRPPGPRAAGAPAPYRGLSSFQPDDAGWFFGREGLTRTVAGRLADRWQAGAGPVLVVGPSGSGKSSLLRAGVIPAVRSGTHGLPPTATLLLTPGAKPLTALVTALAQGTPGAGEPASGDTSITELVAEIHAHPARCADLVRQAVGARGLVIVVDQLEEIFTECGDHDERQAFLAALEAAADGAPDAEAPDGAAAAVLCGLRADFYHRALREPRLVPVLQRGQVPVGPMDESELREAILGPARKAGVDVADGLMELLLRDLARPASGPGPAPAHHAGALPLLSHALRATWERSGRDGLTAAAYEQTGGIRGAVAHTAEAVYENLTVGERELARELFIRLVRVGEDNPTTRRHVRRDELDQLPGLSASALPPELLDDVLDRFIQQRLITVDTDTVEITHEVLVTAWPRLRDWIETDRRGLLLGQQVDEAAREWHREHRDPGLLYRGQRLSAAQEWADGGGARQLSATGREFLRASAHRERRRVRTLYRTVAALAALLLLAVAGGAAALQQRGEARRQQTTAEQERNIALSRMVAVRADRLSSTDPALARQLALAAYRLAPTVEARSSLLSSSSRPAVTRILGPDALLQELAHIPGRGLLIGASDSPAGVWLWDVGDPGQPSVLARTLPGLSGAVNAIAAHPDGNVLATGGADQVVRLYDLADPAEPVRLGPGMPELADTIQTVAFSPDGRTLAAGTEGGRVGLWDVADPAAPVALGEPLTGPAEALTAVAFNPDGQMLVGAGHDTTVHRWDISDPSAPAPLGAPLAGPERPVYSLDFSPDGQTLVGGSGDENLYLWQVAAPEPEPTRVLAGPDGSSWVHSVAFSPDGATVAAGNGDGTTRIWDLARDEVTTELAHPGPVTGLVFTPDGDALYAAAADGVVRRWPLPGPVLSDPNGIAFDVVHHPDRSLAVAASADGHLYLWDVSDPQRPELHGAPLASPSEDSPLVGTVGISPDGRAVAASGRDGTTWRWDITDPARPTPIDPPLPKLPDFAESLRFSPDGDLLAAGVQNGVVQLWDVSEPTRPRPLATMNEGWGHVYSVAFHPDRPILAAGAVDRVVWLWDISDPAGPKLLTEPLTGPSGFVYSVGFSPGGDTLVVGSADETVRFWDITDPARPETGPVLAGPEGYVMWAAFSPDGNQVAAASRDRSVWMWDVRDLAAPARYAVLTAPDGVINTLAYHPSGDALVASSNDTTVRQWRTVPEEVAAGVCATSGDRITEAEWEQYIPGAEYQPPC